MEFKIYSSNGDLKLSVEPKDSSTQVEEVQTGDMLTVSFTLSERVAVEVNDYADFMGRRYWVTEKYLPEQKSTVEWEYSLRLHGLESLISRFLVLDMTDGGNDAVFTLTAPPREHVALIVKSINAGFGTTDWKVGNVESGGNIVVDYHGKYCNQGLKAVADAVGTEYWIEGTTVNLCRCEHGGLVSLGYQNGLTKIRPDIADNAKVYTRLFPVGSSKNIDPEKYGHTRLQLPGGAQYVDINTDKYGIIHHYEGNAFADIFPRYTGTVSGVRFQERTDSEGNKYTVCYFRDDALPFDPNQYDLGSLVKRVTFQEPSELAGLGADDNGTHYFEINFDSATREFEIITQFDDSGQLPGGVLVPKAGDKYIPWNMRMPDEYYPLAEKEYLEAVNEYNRKHCLDVSCYKASTDYVEIGERGLELHVGQRVRLESSEYFPETGYKDSRITKITRKLNCPTQMDIEISDALSTGAIESIKNSIEDVKTSVSQSLGNLPDIIRVSDNTPFTDNNILSALRAMSEFISKRKDDTAAGLITFLKGLISKELSRFKGGAEFGEFVSGMLTGIGGAIDKKGNAEFESLTVRSTMRVMELIINRLGAQEGDTMFAESDTIETVTDNGDGTLLLKLQSKYDGYFTAMTPGMVVRGIINDLATGGGHYYTSWMRVNSVNASANTIEVSLYPDDEVPAGQNFPPCDLMRIARWGHQTDESKQSIFYISSTEGRIVKLFRVTKPIIDFSNYEITLGTLPEKISEILPIALGESGIYVKNLVVEKIWQLDHQGKLLPTIRDRGPYDPAQMYYSGDTLRPETSDYENSEVWYLGCKWRCMVTGVTSPPLWNSTSWAMVEGNPNFSIEFEEGNRIWLDPENIHGTLTIRAWLYNQDVTSEIQDSDIEWTRYTEDAQGVPQVSSDNIWALAHANVGKQLTITAADFPANPMSLKRVEFRVKVTLRDAKHDTTHEDEMAATFIGN